MAKKKTKPFKALDEQIKELSEQLIANSKDSSWGKKSVAQLKKLLLQQFEMNVELHVPCSAVKETVDYGAFKIMRTPQGVLFQCKGGLTTFVEYRMRAVYEMLLSVLETHNSMDKLSEDEKQGAEAFEQAVSYIMQAPIFASISPKILFETATNILRQFREYAENHINDAQPKEETEEDVKANFEAEQTSKAIDELLNSEPPQPTE